MLLAFKILTVMLVAIAMATALAHALELPGKLRLPKETYLAVQPIYYPGFTIAGAVGEFGGMIATLVLAFWLPTGTTAFWLALGAFLSLLCMHGLYWILVHPVNNFWLGGVEVTPAAKGFFSFGSMNSLGMQDGSNWTVLRDRWEWGHIVRAAFAVLGLALLVSAVAVET